MPDDPPRPDRRRSPGIAPTTNVNSFDKKVPFTQIKGYQTGRSKTALDLEETAHWERAADIRNRFRFSKPRGALTGDAMHCLRSSAPIVINRMMGIEMNERAREPSSADGIAWDLGDLYDGMDDPALRADLETAEQRANHFERKYRGTVFSEEGTPSAKLLEALADYEAILEQVGRAVAYVHLLHAAQSDDPKRGALLQSVRERSTAIRKHLIFFDLEWLDVPDGAAEVLLGRPEISRYRHYLEKERKLRPHRLSEPEEKILDEKANTGSRAFVRLFDETLSAARFKVSCDGEVKEMNEQQVLALLYHPDRSQRAAASEGFTEGLRSYRQLLTYIFNVVVLDHKVDDGLRSFPTPMASRNLSNEIDQEVGGHAPCRKRVRARHRPAVLQIQGPASGRGSTV